MQPMRAFWLCVAMVAGAAGVSVRAAAGFTEAERQYVPRTPYPSSLLFSRCIGTTIVRFTVDDHGRTGDVWVEHATHPDFVPAAVETVLGSRFKPAKKEGRPVASERREFFYFEPGSDSIGWGRARTTATPGNWKYGFNTIDATASGQAVQPRNVVNAVFPFDELMAGHTGRAEIELTVGEDGGVTAVALLSASSADFGAALCAMAEACVFVPATSAGKPAVVRLRREQSFAAGAAYLSVNRETRRLADRLRAGEAIAELSALDRKPRAYYQPGAAYPPALLRAGVAGEAEVECLIDEKGRVQLPHIVRASRAEFGWAAATAVQQWFFEAPRQGGKPVAARLRVPMDFRPEHAP